MFQQIFTENRECNSLEYTSGLSAKGPVQPLPRGGQPGGPGRAVILYKNILYGDSIARISFFMAPVAALSRHLQRKRNPAFKREIQSLVLAIKIKKKENKPFLALSLDRKSLHNCRCYIGNEEKNDGWADISNHGCNEFNSDVYNNIFFLIKFCPDI